MVRMNEVLVSFVALVACVSGACFDHATTVLTATSAVDGDTVRISMGLCALPSPLGAELKLRIQGIDTPETFRPQCPSERLMGLAAHDHTTELLLNLRVERVRLCGWDK